MSELCIHSLLSDVYEIVFDPFEDYCGGNTLD